MSEGEVFTDRDVLNANRVCVIGRTVAKELFGNESPLDKEIRIINVPFKVVGVLSPKGANMMGMDQDDIIIAPWTTIKYRVSGSGQNLINQTSTTASTTSTTSSTSLVYPNTTVKLYPEQSPVQIANYMMYTRFANISQIFAAAKSSEQVDSAISEITQLLRERHHLKEGTPDDFSIRNLNEILNTLTKTTKLVTNLLLCIAMVSLLVGGVGIMNIMLVCVSERTREIGIRMAVGARQKDILRQFLTEAVILCLSGGVIGIVIGHGGSMILARILGWPMSASPGAITLAFAVSAAVGIAFGYYPAWKASKLDPIEALRYE
jgi:ABC-type antimicrobial peptide transport system permease subunit